ncbi:MAG: JAB domain-containing protein [Bacteroidota bacterium]|nr:JAB domain-containing protein [Bacteroidota bacterium]
MEENNLEGTQKTEKPEKAIPEIKLQYHTSDLYGKVTSSNDAANIVRKILPEGTIEMQEQVIVLYMNRANNVIGYYRHSTGGVHAAIIDVKLIVSTALKSLSSAILIAHNHPSGNLKPSNEDLEITKKLSNAAKAVDVALLDHVIVTKDGHYSFSDEGVLSGICQSEESKVESEEKKYPVTESLEGTKPTEKTARETAKMLIYGYVERGDTVQSLKAGQMGSHNGEFSASIKANKIHVTEIKNKKVDFSFPLQSIYNEVVDELYSEGKEIEEKPQPKKQTVKKEIPKKKEPQVKQKAETKIKPVERIGEEVKLIKRYAIMEGKEKTDVQLLNFLSAVQKAIVEKRIRKTSPFKKEIEYIQTNLVKLTNALRKIPQESKRIAEIKINPSVLKSFQEIGGSEKVRLSVNYLKRYIGIQGKHLTKEKAQRLLDTLTKAVKAKKIFADDPFAERLQAVYKSLVDFLKVAKKNDTLQIHSEVLNGLNATLDGCSCDEKKNDELNHIEEAEEVQPQIENKVMNSMDFAKLKFETLGFTGKWKQLIGDPCEGFTAMVFGKPKMGKSYFCVEFAGYLARNHGNTLYVAKEEKLDATLQKKLNDKNVMHRCLFVSDHIPDDLTPYQFIFLDSVSKLRLKPEDLERLKAENPGKSFIDIYQTTKTGNFRGTNEHQHDVDVVIEVPEKGKAIQFGRFNQGGEIEIFQNEKQAQNDAPVLFGTKKRYDILSPDGFSIRIGVPAFTSRKKALEYFKMWQERYRIQGYYSSVPYGRIPLEDLEDYCQWIEV